MRLLTLNLRHGGGARMPRLLAHLRAHEADVLVLTEHRHNAASVLLREGLAAAGYVHQLASAPGAPDRRGRRGRRATPPRTNHVLVAARRPLRPAREPALAFDPLRLLPVRLDGLRLVGLHLPNLKAKLPHWAALLRLAARLERRPGGEPAVFLGDFNTGHAPQDVETPGFAFTASGQLAALEARGWVDAWRRLHPHGREYTWYSHRRNGFRLDHALLSPACAPALRAARFDHTVRTSGASDHAALIVDLAL